MSRPVKCYGTCGEKHPKEDMKQISGKNYCPKCYEQEMSNRVERDKLYEYIQEEYQTPFVTPLIKKHINEFIASGLSYKKIRHLIHYCNHVKKGFNKPDMKYGIILYGNYYHEMAKYYSEQKKRKDQNKGKRHEKRVVVITDEVFRENKYKKSKQIDLEDIE